MGTGFALWFDGSPCFLRPSLCSRSRVDKCAPSFTVASRCFNNREHAQTIHSVRGLLSVFFGESACFSILSIYPRVHIPWRCDVSPLAPWVPCCSQLVLMPHQVVMAFQLLRHSFLYVPRGFFFFSFFLFKRTLTVL